MNEHIAAVERLGWPPKLLESLQIRRISHRVAGTRRWYDAAGRRDRPRRGIVMEFEDTGAKRTQMMALLMTLCVVGGALFYALSA